MDNRLNFWRSRSLTLLGRCLIFKSLGIPQLIYSASMSSMPIEASVKLITNYLFNFIWNKKPDKIKRQVMYQDYMDGGLHVPNVLTTFRVPITEFFLFSHLNRYITRITSAKKFFDLNETRIFYEFYKSLKSYFIAVHPPR